MIAWLFRLLLLALLGYLLYNLVRCLFFAVSRNNDEAEGVAEGEKENTVLDLECGNYIHPRDALTRKVAGQIYYFCSRECRDAFCDRHRDDPVSPNKE